MTQSRRVVPFARILAATATLAIVSSRPVSALWEAADGEVFLSLNASVRADSNIGSSSTDLSDTIYSVTPGISWERNRGRGSISLSGQAEIQRAAEYDSYDSENYSADFALNMAATPSGRLHGGFNAGYFDGSRVNSFQNTRVSESSYDLGLNGAYQVSNKINARTSLSYDKTSPDDLPDYDSTAYSFGLGYNIRPLVSTFLDLRITESSSRYEVTEGRNSGTSGKALMVGVDGQITDRLSGSIGVGYDWTESDMGTAGDTEYSGINYDVSLDWNPRDRTSISLSASNGIRAASSGATKFKRIELSASQEIGLNMSANLSLGYRTNDYEASARGDDEVMDASLGLTYAFTRQISMGGSLAYTDSSSTNGLFDYRRTVWSVFGNVRY